MSSNAEFKAEVTTDIPVASGPSLKRLFLDIADGFFKTKDSAGNVAPIATLAIPFIHNPTIIAPQVPYLAVYQETVKVFPDAGLQTVLLPTAIGFPGRQIKVVSTTDMIGPPTITITPFGVETINGDPSKTITTPRERYTLESDGAVWLVVD